jgi:hypothetical protein
MIIFAILMAFAWAIGGEKYFGKWRRGVLVAILSVLLGIYLQLAWYWILILAGMFYLYQALFYDDAIKLIWEDHNPMGWPILFINGAICGLYPAVIWAARGHWLYGWYHAMAAGAAFCFICWLSNGLKWSWNGCKRIYGVGWWCPADAWWWACWIYGLILGVLSIC